MKANGPLHLIPIKASKRSKIFEAETAEDLLANVFYQSPEEKKALVKSEKYRWFAAFILGFLGALVPFFVRIARHFPFFGNCLSSESCTEDDNNALRYLAVASFCINFALYTWYIFMLTNTYFIYYERNRLMERLYAILKQEESTRENVPYIKFESAHNVIVWSKIRIFIQSFKTVEIRRSETILATMVLVLSLLVPFVIYQRFHPFVSIINSNVLYVISGVGICFLGVYIAYPVIYTGLMINLLIDKISAFLSEEKWRLSIRAEVAKTEDKREQIRFAYTVTKAQYNNIQEVDTTFTILGVKITPALFISVASAVTAGVVSCLADLYDKAT